ncbi:helix-turn-helix transcriptional regulator [Sphaerothrix gracilis]|uniref:helix-turn-helix domain-containing protein n=1 Tax=Sphaerothrix gracilis TaxID=3151835 RepID=UPI0031FD9802
MAKAGEALRNVLKVHGISQNKLAVTMGINRSTVHQWIHEVSDPQAEAVTEIAAALYRLNPAAAKDFIQRYFSPTHQALFPDADRL